MLAWDRTHDWVLVRVWHDLTRVEILFRQPSPSVAELASIRRCLPQFRHMPPASVRAAIGGSGTLPLGEMPTPEARRLIEAARAEQLQVAAEDASFVSYLPLDRTTGCALVIEDDEESAAVAQEMLAAGVPVQPIEA